MVSNHQEIVSEQQFIAVSCSMMVLAFIFLLLRIGVQIRSRKLMEVQDFLIYFAFVCFLTLSICYLILVPRIYEVQRVAFGTTDSWPSMKRDIAIYVRMMFATTSLFWISLWSVKLSFLALYRKLLQGLPMLFTRLWWALLAFCLLSLAGCIISYVTSCSDFVASLSTGECSGSRSVRGQLASLYSTYAADVLSDLMIMALPIKLVWGLQMARSQKIAIIALFASAIVCIAFATLRVVQIGVEAGNHTSPSPIWLALWTVIESAVAICIGCCPALASRHRTANTRHESYDMHGYLRHNQEERTSDRHHLHTRGLTSIGRDPGHRRTSRSAMYWDGIASSQEELARESKDIRATTTLQQDVSMDTSKEDSTTWSKDDAHSS